MMNIKRIALHLTMTLWHVKRAFTPHSFNVIEEAIKASEIVHAGQIRFVVEGALDCAPLFRHQSSAQRAIDVFSQLRIWDTELNCGVLIYVLFADRAVEIVADRGIYAKVGADEWVSICRQMELDFKHGRFTSGAVAGINAVTQILMQHFPAVNHRLNELTDKPLLI